ncbi:hypothetical protein, partial [Microcoleus sp. Pol17_C1]|uniref:hypothetical protein n=1 Tax=unclassified Microcoleus TaxID=2642155 RepID=UPI002FD28350
MDITADFLDDCWQPPESEFQPLLDFESEISREVPHNDISLLSCYAAKPDKIALPLFLIFRSHLIT